MDSIVLNGASVRDRAAALDAFAPYFPDYYGRNLDALWDCLTDFSGAMEIRFVNCAALRANLGPFWDQLQMVLEKAREENPLLSVIIEN